MECAVLGSTSITGWVVVFFLLPSCGWHLSDDANNGLGNLRSTHINGRDVWRFLISNHDENCDGILCWS